MESSESSRSTPRCPFSSSACKMKYPRLRMIFSNAIAILESKIAMRLLLTYFSYLISFTTLISVILELRITSYSYFSYKFPSRCMLCASIILESRITSYSYFSYTFPSTCTLCASVILESRITSYSYFSYTFPSMYTLCASVILESRITS